MKKNLLSRYVHRPGRHCGSTALSNWLRYFGHDLDEPTAFGLGAGLGFVYFESPALSPSRMILTRAAFLEVQTWRHLGIPVDDRSGADAEAIWETNKRMIDRGLPVIIGCDLAHLPYWNTKTHFNGHRITIVGYDDDRRVVLLADTHFEGLQECDYDSLLQSRTSKHPPSLATDSLYHDPDPSTSIRPLADAFREALQAQTKEMLHHRMGEHGGVTALRRLAERLGSWGEAKDWKWAFRFSYQVIEKRGTGGAAFRKMYAEFLERAESILPAVERLGLASLMRDIQADWEALATEFYRLSELESPGDTSSAVRLVAALADREEAWAQRVASAPELQPQTGRA